MFSGECSRLSRELCRPSMTNGPRRCRGVVGRVGSVRRVILACHGCGRTIRARGSDLRVLRRADSGRLGRLTRVRLSRTGSGVGGLTRSLGVLLLPGSPGSRQGIVIRVHNNTNNRRSTLFDTILFEVCSVCTRGGNFGVRVVGTGRARVNNCGRVSFVVRNRNTCSHFGCRDNIRHIRQMPRARDRNEIRASAAAITILPRTRSIRLRVSPGSLGVSAFHSDNTNNRRVGGADSTVQVARLPANVMIRYRSREDRCGGGSGTLGILGDQLLGRGRSGRTDRVTRGEGVRMNANSHDRQVHACGCPRNEMASREVNLALCGLRRVLGNDLSRIVSTLITTSETRGLGRDVRGWSNSGYRGVIIGGCEKECGGHHETTWGQQYYEGPSQGDLQAYN